MNRTIMILHLLVSISVARPIGESPTTIIGDQNYKTDEIVPRSPDEIEDVLSVLVKKDDILTTSDIARIYNLLENKLGKIRSLRDEPENEGYKNAEPKHQSRAAVKSKSTENVKAEDKSDTTDKVVESENRAASREESKLEEKSVNSDTLIKIDNMAPTREEIKTEEKLIDIDPITGANEENKSDNLSSTTTMTQLEEKFYANEAEDFKSKASIKEKRKSEVTRVLEESKSTTGIFGEEDNFSEYLENDGDNFKVDSKRNGNGNYFNDRVDINNRSAPKENSGKIFRNDKVENDNKNVPKEDSRSSYRNLNVETNDKHASKTGYRNDKVDSSGKRAPKEDSRSGFRNYEVEVNDDRAPKVDSRSGYPNDKGESNYITASTDDTERKGYEMPINDESNSSWDLLDDIPVSRRMLTHDNFNIEIKGKAADENVDSEQDSFLASDPTPISSRNDNSYGPTTPQYDRSVLNPEGQSTVSMTQYWSTIPNPQFRRPVLNPKMQNTVPSQQIQTWNPQFQSIAIAPNLQFQTLNPLSPSTVLNPQTQTVPSTKFKSTVLNPPFPSTVLNPQFPTVPNLHFPSTVSIPHIHPSSLPIRRFIIPGLIRIRPATPIDFRRLYSQEENHVLLQNPPNKPGINLNENVNYRNDERSESKEANIEDNSNAYPYSPVDLEKPKSPQFAMVNPIFSKLVEASEHPQRFHPNFNGGNVQNIPYYKFK